MSEYRPGDTVIWTFPISSPTSGAGASFTGSPTVKMYRNGTEDTNVTSFGYTSITTGLCKLTFTIPSGYTLGDFVAVTVQGVVGGVTTPPTPVFQTKLQERVNALTDEEYEIIDRICSAVGGRNGNLSESTNQIVETFLTTSGGSLVRTSVKSGSVSTLTVVYSP